MPDNIKPETIPVYDARGREIGRQLTQKGVACLFPKTVDEETDSVLFIEGLQKLPISLRSNSNEDYIEMGERIYKYAKEFFHNA